MYYNRISVLLLYVKLQFHETKRNIFNFCDFVSLFTGMVNKGYRDEHLNEIFILFECTLQ